MIWRFPNKECRPVADEESKEMSNHHTYIVDIASSEQDDTCPMKTWFGKFEGGRGIVPKNQVLPNQMIAETHADFRHLAKMMDITPENIQKVVESALSELTPEDKLNRKAMELLYRRLGWFVAYALFKEPEVRAKYYDVGIDAELILDRDPLWVVTEPDRLLMDRGTEEYTYLEYTLMPPGISNKNWLQQWLYNIRLHVGIAALADAKKINADYGQMMGLSEGYISSVDGRLVHPYVWGYRDDKGNWSIGFKTENEGFKPTPVWEFPGGIMGWVQLCGKTAADFQFQLSPPIRINRAQVNEWVSRRLHRERAVKIMADTCHVNYHLRTIHFQKNSSQCRPANGPACPFLKACWDKDLAVNAFKTGEYVPNVIPLVEIKVGEVVS